MSIRSFFFFGSLLFLLSLSSCGYQFGYGNIPSHYKTIMVPFVIGDHTGAITAEIIKAISTSGAFEYQTCQADLSLIVKVLEYRDENIGFRYDRDRDGQLKETLVPAETRRYLKVEVNLFDTRSRCRITGPDIITAYVDFDHEFNSSRDAVNVFSLGQVTDIDEAFNASSVPLNQAIAAKIVHYLANAW